MSRSYDSIQHRLRSLTKEIDDTLLNSYSVDNHVNDAPTLNRIDLISRASVEFLRHDSKPQRTKFHVPESHFESDPPHLLGADVCERAGFEHGAPLRSNADNTVGSPGFCSQLEEQRVSREQCGRESFAEASPFQVDEQLRISLRRERLEEERSLAHLRMAREKLEQEIDQAIQERTLLMAPTTKTVNHAPATAPCFFDENQFCVREVVEGHSSLQRPERLALLPPERPQVHRDHREIPQKGSQVLCDVPVMIVPSDDGPSVSAKVVFYSRKGCREPDVVVVPASEGIFPLSLSGEEAHIRLVLPYSCLGQGPQRLGGGSVLCGSRGRRLLIRQGCTSFSMKARGRHLRLYCLWVDEDGQELMCVWQFLNIAHAATALRSLGCGGARPLSQGRALWLLASGLLFTTPKGLSALSDARSELLREARERADAIREAERRRHAMRLKALEMHSERSGSRPEKSDFEFRPPAQFANSESHASLPRGQMKKVIRLRRVVSPSARSLTSLNTPSNSQCTPSSNQERRDSRSVSSQVHRISRYPPAQSPSDGLGSVGSEAQRYYGAGQGHVKKR